MLMVEKREEHDPGNGRGACQLKNASVQAGKKINKTTHSNENAIS